MKHYAVILLFLLTKSCIASEVVCINNDMGMPYKYITSHVYGLPTIEQLLAAYKTVVVPSNFQITLKPVCDTVSNFDYCSTFHGSFFVEKGNACNDLKVSLSTLLKLQVGDFHYERKTACSLSDAISSEIMHQIKIYQLCKEDWISCLHTAYARKHEKDHVTQIRRIHTLTFE